MITVYFALDNRKAYKGSKTVPLLADITYTHGAERVHFRFSTRIACNPKNFSDQVIHGREPNSADKSALLANIKKTAEGIYFAGLNLGTLPDAATFKDRIKLAITAAKTEKSTIDHLDSYVANLESKKKSRHTTLGMKRLKSLLEKMKESGISINLENIDMDFETAMLAELDKRGFNGNTRGSYIKRLKMFLNWCIKNGRTQNQIFKQFEIIEESREVVALSETEVGAIAGLNIPTHKHIEKGLKLSRDWFIISTQTGLRYSDLHKVANAKITQADGGYDMTIEQTQKTKAKVIIPMSRLLYKTLKEYNFSPPAPPSNQKYNENLKTIATDAEIHKVISSHTGRKTFATAMYRKQKPVPWIMKMTGHRTEKEFYKYIGVDLTENAAMVRDQDQMFQIDIMSA